jgi:hypothetical protein
MSAPEPIRGAHAPEFGFEHDLDNVRRAATDLRVDFPVVIDNDFTVWRSFANHYWPAARSRTAFKRATSTSS